MSSSSHSDPLARYRVQLQPVLSGRARRVAIIGAAHRGKTALAHAICERLIAMEFSAYRLVSVYDIQRDLEAAALWAAESCITVVDDVTHATERSITQLCLAYANARSALSPGILIVVSDDDIARYNLGRRFDCIIRIAQPDA